MKKYFLCILLISLMCISPLQAEKLALKLSHQIVALTPNYTGGEVTVFGAIEVDKKTISRAGEYQIVVSVIGPSKRAYIRLKDKLGPIWITSDERRVYSFPAYVALLSSQPLYEITTPAVRGHLKLGFVEILKNSQLVGGQGVNAAEFKVEILRLAQQQKLWIENPEGVKMFGQNLFTSTIALPSNAPSGPYLVEVILLADGLPLARENQIFQLEKIGFESSIEKIADRTPLLYGILVAIMAVFMGWIGWALFKRD